jgi:hypothetical protein
MANIVADGQIRAQEASYEKVRKHYLQIYSKRLEESTLLGRIYWRMVLQIEIRRKLVLLASKYAVYLSAIFLACLTTACSVNLVDLVETSQISEDVRPELTDVQDEVEFPLLSLSNPEYRLFSVQVIPGIEPGNEDTQRVLMMYEHVDSVLVLAQEPVSSEVEPPGERIKEEAANYETVRVGTDSAVLVAEETGHSLYWERNGISIVLTGNIDPADLVELAQGVN